MTVHCSLIRSIVEYTSVVFANLPRYLSDALERVQKRALAISSRVELAYQHMRRIGSRHGKQLSLIAHYFQSLYICIE